MPGGSEGGMHGIRIVEGGLVLPGDVVRVVALDVDEAVWEEAVRDVRREGYEAVVAVDMSADGDEGGDVTSPDAAPTASTAA
ncbi:hypothetical protein V8C35DRAFT_317018 [Trichoderma chlorosporum]